MSALEDELLYHIRVWQLPEPQREYKFHPVRRWKFDFAYPDLLIAIECEGATWTGGRHTSGAGFEKDAEKYNTAALAGWLVLRFTSSMVRDGRAIEAISEAVRKAQAGEV